MIGVLFREAGIGFHIHKSDRIPETNPRNRSKERLLLRGRGEPRTDLPLLQIRPEARTQGRPIAAWLTDQTSYQISLWILDRGRVLHIWKIFTLSG